MKLHPRSTIFSSAVHGDSGAVSLLQVSLQASNRIDSTRNARIQQRIMHDHFLT